MLTISKIFQRDGIEVHSEEEMRALGFRIAALLEPGDVIGISGELGVGKTRLVQGILNGLGCSQPATSPTFSIVHEHIDGRLPVAHFDFYRLRHPDEVLQIGWEDYLYGHFVLLVEWADMFSGSLMPANTIRLHIEDIGTHTRRVKVQSSTNTF